MTQTTTNIVVHVLAILAGVLGIVSAAASTLGIPAYASGIIGVAITVCVYLANQIPNLGAGTPPPAAPAVPPVVAPPVAAP